MDRILLTQGEKDRAKWQAIGTTTLMVT